MTQVINCLVVDDEPPAREGIAEYVQETPFLSLVGTCKNALEASTVLQSEEVDLLFLDIQMPKITGLDFFKSLHNPPLVVFTTAYREYALDGFELDALDYLVKPIAYPRFLKAANKALDFLQQQEKSSSEFQKEDDFFFIKSDGKYLKIFFEDILFLEGLKDYVFIHTSTEKYLTLISLKNAEKELPPADFLRVHRSYIVALDKVEAIEGNQVRIGEQLIPIGKSNREEVLEKVVKGRLWKR